MKSIRAFTHGSLLLFLTALLASCGGGGASGGETVVEGDTPPTFTAPGVAVIKFRAAGAGWAALTEHLLPLVDMTTPDRRLLVAVDGRHPAVTIGPSAGWSLIDFALHPSGEMSVVLANDTQLLLQRRAANGDLLGESTFSDEQAASDPFIGDIARIRDSQSLVPLGTRDAVRLAPLGEDLVMAFRTGRNAVVAQRLSYAGGNHLQRLWRTLVEPGVPIDLVRLTSGTFDPFASLDNQWHVSMDSDEQGRIAIGVSLGHTELPAAHGDFFSEPIDPGLVSGAILTLLSDSGQRMRATVIDTHFISEVHVVRWAGDAVLVAGRMLTRPGDGGGWDGFLAKANAGETSAQAQALDFDRGDVILDAEELPDGRIVIAGATAYVQNPSGGSISEDAQPLLAVLSQGGIPAQRLSPPAGPRQNQVRTVSDWRGHWLTGGLENGPGTHSADADPTLLTCDGFLREQPF
jgi:hypothetical protein